MAAIQIQAQCRTDRPGMQECRWALIGAVDSLPTESFKLLSNFQVPVASMASPF